MKNFTLSFLFAVAFSAITFSSRAQCPTPGGMTGTSLTFSGNCFFFVQFAIPNSNVSIYNASGFVGQAVANASGSVVIPYTCAQAPITAILSFHSSGSFCSNYNITLPIALPIKLTSFTGHIVSSGVLLKWETSFEFNNEKYLIEKSTDGKNFQTIGQIAGAINSLDKNNYDFNDGGFRTGDVAYYRLKQVDLDGNFTYSKIVYVNSSDSRLQTIRIAPNPFSSEIQLIGVNSSKLNRNNIRVQNIAGAQVDFEFSGANAIRIAPNAPTGMYILTVDGVAYKIMKN